jgi:hypothetical protein
LEHFCYRTQTLSPSCAANYWELLLHVLPDLLAIHLRVRPASKKFPEIHLQHLCFDWRLVLFLISMLLLSCLGCSPDDAHPALAVVQ